MFPSYLQLMIPIMSLAVNVVIQILRFRITPGRGLLKSVVEGFIGGLLYVLMIEIYIQRYLFPSPFPEFIFMTIANTIIYAACGYCYFHFINLGETARRIRVLRELYECDGALSMQEILQRYHAKEIVEKRLGRLLRNNQVMYRDGRYYTKKSVMMVIAHIIVVLKWILLGRKNVFCFIVITIFQL